MSEFPPAGTRVVNALTIDVVDYFQDFEFSAAVPQTDWDTFPSRVAPNIARILDILAEFDVHATFFSLGWLAERHPQVVRRIVACGHELASHGYANVHASHERYGMFLADARLAKAVLEDVSGTPVSGYRAAGLSLGIENAWGFDCLVEAGYRYSSSVYPTGRRLRAIDAPRFAHEIRTGLIEVPVSTVRALGANWPAGGGDAFRLLPYDLMRWSIRRIHAVDHQPAVLYFRSWEFDVDEPPLRGPGPVTRFRHGANRAQMVPRVRRLLADFRWDRMDAVLARL